MDHICRIILNLQHDTNSVSLKRIRDRFKALAEKNLENGNLYEVIWLTYTLRGLKIPLRSKTISELIEFTPSSSLALILLDMKSKNLYFGPLPTDKWAKKINNDTVKSDWIWLLAYEAIRKGWLRDLENVMTSPFFKL